MTEAAPENEFLFVEELAEPINMPPPAYFEHEFLFVDDSEEEEIASPPAYSVPFIDPPEYGNTEILTVETPPEKDFEPPDGLLGCEITMDIYRPHPIHSHCEANIAGIVRRISDGKIIENCPEQPVCMKIRNNAGKTGRVRRAKFVWECYWGVPLGPNEGIIWLDRITVV